MFDFLRKWGLDPKTAIITLLIIPIFMVVKRVITKYFKEWAELLTDGVMYLINRYITQSIAAKLTMKRYCRLNLGNERIKFLHIPSSRDITLDIDKIFVKLTLTHLADAEKNFDHKTFLTVGNRLIY